MIGELTMTATIEIQAGQVWEIGGKLYRVDSVDGRFAQMCLACFQSGTFAGRIAFTTPRFGWDASHFDGGKLIALNT